MSKLFQVQVLSEIERLSILTKLVKKYCLDLSILEAIKLAKDLVKVIDELNFCKVDLKELTDDFISFFPEHWKKRTQFLLIVTKYWPEILKELGKEQIDPTSNRARYYVSDFQCSTKDLRYQLDLGNIKNTIHTFEAESLLNEIDFIASIVKNSSGKIISIVFPDKNFADLLSHRFKIEKIYHTSYVNNSFEELPNEFFKEIDTNFNDVLEPEKSRLIRELSSFTEVKKVRENVSIVNVDDIKFLTSNIIFLSTLNENSWNSVCSSEYWLHSSLRKKMGLMISAKDTIEDDFYACFNGISEIYLTRSKKVDGVSASKSSILSKFEAICKKNNVKLDKITDCSKSYFCTLPTNFEIKKDFFKLPSEITTGDIELLMKDPQGFYAKNILNLRTMEIDNDKQKFAIAFKNFLRSYFDDKPKAINQLNIIKILDFFGYQKCLNIMKWLEKRNISGRSYNNVLGRINFSRLNVTISGRCDRLEERSKDSMRIITYKTSMPQSTKDIIYGNDSAIMTTCLIVEKGGFENVKLPVREIQVWSLSDGKGVPINIKSIEISEDLIRNFETRLNKILENYKTDSKLKYNRYKHFERG